MEMQKLSIVLLTNVFFLVHASLEKQWIVSTFFHDVKNWNPQRLPCTMDKTIKLANDVVYIGQNRLITQELVLAQNGDIQFAEDIEISFARNLGQTYKDPEAPCTPVTDDNVIHFVGQPDKRWGNPMNWRTNRNSKDVSDHSPYIERIPCESDKVTFQPGRAFSLFLFNNVSVREMDIQDQSYTNEELQSYMNTELGRMNFKLDGVKKSKGALRIDPSRRDCLKRGCVCRNHLQPKDLCTLFSCPDIKCSREVLPADDCCLSCGEAVLFQDKDGFDLQSCWNDLEGMIANNNYVNVSLFLSRTDTRNVQVFIKDKSDGTKAFEAGSHVKKYLSDINSPETCQGTQIKALSQKGDLKPINPSSKTAKIVLAIVISIVLIIVIIVIFYIAMRRRRRSKDLAHKKFTNDEGDVDVVQYTTTSFNGESTAYANPTFDMEDKASINDYQIPVDTDAPALSVEKSKFDSISGGSRIFRKIVDDNDVEENYCEEKKKPAFAEDDEDIKKHMDVVDLGTADNPLYKGLYEDQDEDGLPPYSEIDLDDDEDTKSVKSLKDKLQLKVELEDDDDQRKDEDV